MSTMQKKHTPTQPCIEGVAVVTKAHVGGGGGGATDPPPAPDHFAAAAAPRPRSRGVCGRGNVHASSYAIAGATKVSERHQWMMHPKLDPGLKARLVSNFDCEKDTTVDSGFNLNPALVLLSLRRYTGVWTMEEGAPALEGAAGGYSVVERLRGACSIIIHTSLITFGFSNHSYQTTKTPRFIVGS